MIATVGVAALSTLAAFAIQALQRRSLGDDPIIMLVFGCALGVLSTWRLRTPILGLIAMVGFPISATADLVAHGGHSLFPIEFATYAFYGVIGAIAAQVIGMNLGRNHRSPDRGPGVSHSSQGRSSEGEQAH